MNDDVEQVRRRLTSDPPHGEALARAAGSIRRHELDRLRDGWLAATQRRFKSAPDSEERTEADALARHYALEYVRVLGDAEPTVASLAQPH